MSPSGVMESGNVYLLPKKKNPSFFSWTFKNVGLQYVTIMHFSIKFLVLMFLSSAKSLLHIWNNFLQNFTQQGSLCVWIESLDAFFRRLCNYNSINPSLAQVSKAHCKEKTRDTKSLFKTQFAISYPSLTLTLNRFAFQIGFKTEPL